MHPAPVALVTGGSRGIGRAVCAALSARGYSIGVNYVGNEVAARETRALLGESVLCQGDVSLADDRKRIVEHVLATYNRIDLLVNNAGITSVGRRDILEATEESWDRVLGVNLKGPFFLSQMVANAMIPRRGMLQHPAIVNITSLSAYAVSVNRGDYCVSKAGMSVVTALFATRLAEHGIRVYEVRPGVIDTDMTAGVRDLYLQRIADGLNPIRRMGTPDDVARAVTLLASGELSFTTGDVINVDGGFHLRRL
jgi:NAD(P)-dependent dehydrogenase (short-subunit alcohol dehydrogenase family)